MLRPHLSPKWIRFTCLSGALASVSKLSAGSVTRPHTPHTRCQRANHCNNVVTKIPEPGVGPNLRASFRPCQTRSGRRSDAGLGCDHGTASATLDHCRDQGHDNRQNQQEEDLRQVVPPHDIFTRLEPT